MKRQIVFWGVLPLLLLAVLSVLLMRGGLIDFLRQGVPLVEELSFERVTLAPGKMTIGVVNGGPSPVTIAQVMVDEAYWPFAIRPGPDVPRLGRATIELDYPWVTGEPHGITIVTNTGATFGHEIPVAAETPPVGPRFFGVFALIGLYVGVVPVAIGLLWYPMLRRLERRWIHFVLALTAGLLVFLGVDAFHEALESGALVGGAFQGTAAVVVAALATLLFLQTVARRRLGSEGPEGRAAVAWLIALGIGLHNMGEGLAIGAAYALGEATLGAFLMIGFMLHNSTEGLGIVAPIAQDRPSLRTLLGMGLLAGGPTILGAWIGGMASSPLFTTIFLAIGAGAIVQVVLALYRVIARETQGPVWTPLTAGGLVAGMLVMYATGLLVAA